MAEQVICGWQSVARLVRANPERILELCLQTDLGRQRRARLPAPLPPGLLLRELPLAALTKLAGTHKHQGVVARIAGPVILNEAQACERVAAIADPLLLVLDGVQDPRNFGACLRTADAAGVDLVIIGRSRNVGVTPVVSKVAAGAAEVQPMASVGNLARFLSFLGKSGVVVLGADDQAAADLYAVSLTGPLALVLGAEGAGLRRLTRERCDQLVRLPMQGAVESLNVAVATGVCLYEALRQRR